MKIFIVAGGTGGHLLPAIRLTEEIKLRKAAEVLFITSSKESDGLLLREKGIMFHTLPLIGMQAGNILDILNFIARLIAGTIKSVYLLARFRPDCVIGFGGYVTGPMLLISSLSRIRTIIHEQNVYPGRANRLLARFVDRIAVNFRESITYIKDFESKIIVSGNPLRRGLKKERKERDIFTVLAMGGSQGAQTLNRLVPEAFGMIEQDKRNRFEVIHIAGYKEKREVEASYNSKGIANRVFSFTHDMDKLYSECDFVIARAGATTVSELLCLGKPSILIPYPYAGAHQRLNAEVLEHAGLAILMDEHGLKAGALRDAIASLMDRDRLNEMSKNSQADNTQDACDILIKEVLSGR